MGRGKGATKYWAAVVKPGRILYEIGAAENIARKAILVAASKMPVQTKFITGSSEFSFNTIYFCESYRAI